MLDISETYKYYAILDFEHFDDVEKKWLEFKKIENVIRYKKYGYAVRIFEHELESIKDTMTIMLNVWPDGDSYCELTPFKIKTIYKETTTICEL